LAGKIEAEKRAAAEAAASRVTDGMVVGLGTGSTADFAILKLGERVAAGLRISGVPTSRRSEDLARRLGIPLVTLQDVERIDLTIDGADEIDSESLALIKGQGGALVREKLVAVASRSVIIVADSTKIVDRLGGRHPVPVEVLAYGWRVPLTSISGLGGRCRLRTNADGTPFVTDNSNYILDVDFGRIEAPDRLAEALKAFTGVVDHGLFIDIADSALVATDGNLREYRRPGAH
jgi:ribose 5-phosphate isomerase A